jgi:hypothetical protein
VIVILAVGLVWLLAATVVASVVGRAIRRADEQQPEGTVLDRLLVEGYRDLEAIHASRLVDRRYPRAA